MQYENLSQKRVYHVILQNYTFVFVSLSHILMETWLTLSIKIYQELCQNFPGKVLFHTDSENWNCKNGEKLNEKYVEVFL